MSVLKLEINTVCVETNGKMGKKKVTLHICIRIKEWEKRGEVPVRFSRWGVLFWTRASLSAEKT